MNMNLRTLRKRCNAKMSSFWPLGQEYTTKDGSYTYIDRGGKVLAVAHLDTVNDYDHFYHLILGKDHIVYSTALDDRLGAYIILDLLPKEIGEDFDVLLTEGEEMGRSTAYYFTPSHEYNWMFQFDRHGDDVVMYQYETPEYLALLKDYHFKAYPGAGAFSDISCMDELNCAGFNFGCGYEDNHSVHSHADLNVTEMMVRKFIKFYKDYKDIYLEKPEVPTRKNWRSYYPLLEKDGGTSGYNSFSKYDIGDCVNCGAYNVDTDEDGLCAACAKFYGNNGKVYTRCISCNQWELVDEYGICKYCYLDDEGKG